MPILGDEAYLGGSSHLFRDTAACSLWITILMVMLPAEKNFDLFSPVGPQMVAHESLALLSYVHLSINPIATTSINITTSSNVILLQAAGYTQQAIEAWETLWKYLQLDDSQWRLECGKSAETGLVFSQLGVSKSKVFKLQVSLCLFSMCFGFISVNACPMF